MICPCEGCKNEHLTKVRARVAERRRQREAKAKQEAIDGICKRLGAQCLALFEKHKDATWLPHEGPAVKVAGMSEDHVHYALAKGLRNGYSRERHHEALRAEALRRILNRQGWTCMPWFGQGLDARLRAGITGPG